MESAKDVGKNVEVNECQKALDKLKTHCLSSPSLQNGEENGFGPDYDMHHDCYEDETQLLQELVDKQKSKKPIGELYNEICGNCGENDIRTEGCNAEYNYCPWCGTEIDWSKDE